MEVPVEIRKAHAQLSNANASFLDFVGDHPEYLKRSAYPGFDEIQFLSGYDLQVWPTFISTTFLADIYEGNKGLCHLIKVIPHRLFGNDPSRFAQFYDLNAQHASLVVATYSNRRWVEETMSRGDFMLTANGFKCLEYNIASRIGGWPSTWATRGMLKMPPIRQFIEEYDVVTQEGETFRVLANYLIRQGLKRFSSNEINIAALVDPSDLGEAIYRRRVQIFKTLREEFERIERLLGGKVCCRLLEALPDQLKERNGMLYHEQHRVHGVLEGSVGSAGPVAMGCWIKGTVDLYNGPATPVMNDKRNLALLSELKDSDLLSASERQVVEDFLPWTRRVSKDKLHPQAAEPVTRRECLERRPELVLKPSNESAGKDVFIGTFCDEKTWEDVVDRAFEEGHWLVQEYLEPPEYMCQLGDDGFGLHNMVWGSYLFGDRDGGTFLRVAPCDTNGPINCNIGAEIAVVVEVKEEPEAHQ